MPCCLNSWLILENGLLPKNPLYALRGEGCTDSMQVCFVTSIRLFFRRADAPHNTKTIFSFFWLMQRMTSSVKVSQPLPWWDAGAPCRTVNVVFKSNIPCSAHAARSPLCGFETPRSSSSSLKIFWSLSSPATSYMNYLVMNIELKSILNFI